MVHKKKGHGSAPPRPPGDPLWCAGWWRLVSYQRWSRWDKTEHAHGCASSSYSRATRFIMSNDENIHLTSLGASHSGKDYMDAKASRLLGMWANWLRTEPSWSNKLLYFEYKESLLTFSCSLGFTGAAISPLLANLTLKVDFTRVLSLRWICSILLENIPKLYTFSSAKMIRRKHDTSPSISFSLLAKVQEPCFLWRLPQPSQKKINHLIFSSHIFLFLNSLFSASDLSTNLFFYSCAYSILFLTYFVL